MLTTYRTSSSPHVDRLVGLSLVLATGFVGVPPLSAQVKTANEDEKGIIRRQQFKSLDDAMARAKVELEREHTLGVATIIYSARTDDNQQFRGNSQFRFVGPSCSGYIGGTVSDGEYILQPVFISSSTRAAELHLLVPGYDRFARRVILRAGDLLVWDDIVLDPLTSRNSGSVAGRVRLEDQNEELSGILILADGEPVAFTDNEGYFTIPQVQAGTVKVCAAKIGYVGLCAEFNVSVGGLAAHLLVGHRKRYAHVYWAYQPDGTRSFDGDVQIGEAVLMARNLCRVSFAPGFKNHNLGRSDFLVEQIEDQLVLRHVDVQGQERPASLRITNRTFDDLEVVPESGYTQSKWTLRPGDLFVFRCYDGVHYAMMEVVDVTDKEPVLPARDQ